MSEVPILSMNMDYSTVEQEQATTDLAMEIIESKTQ